MKYICVLFLYVSLTVVTATYSQTPATVAIFDNSAACPAGTPYNITSNVAGATCQNVNVLGGTYNYELFCDSNTDSSGWIINFFSDATCQTTTDYIQGAQISTCTPYNNGQFSVDCSGLNYTADPKAVQTYWIDAQCTLPVPNLQVTRVVGNCNQDISNYQAYSYITCDTYDTSSAWMIQYSISGLCELTGEYNAGNVTGIGSSQCVQATLSNWYVTVDCSGVYHVPTIAPITVAPTTAATTIITTGSSNTKSAGYSLYSGSVLAVVGIGTLVTIAV